MSEILMGEALKKLRPEKEKDGIIQKKTEDSVK